MPECVGIFENVEKFPFSFISASFKIETAFLCSKKRRWPVLVDVLVLQSNGSSVMA